MDVLPSFEEYREAFETVVFEDLPENYQRMLRAHFCSPRQIISKRDLFAATAYSEPAGRFDVERDVHGDYGALAGRLCRNLISHYSPKRLWHLLGSDASDDRRIQMHSQVADAIGEMGWFPAEFGPCTLPEEVADPSLLYEGTTTRISVNIYERNAAARRQCIGHFGLICRACDFDFARFYGPLGSNYIHVHHRREISSIGKEYVVDPIRDLVPVCPNCHAMLHRQTPALSIDELKDRIEEARKVT